MAGYRIDELALLAGTNVRNVRVCQDRGLLAQGVSHHRQEALGDHFAAVLEYLKREAVTPVRSE